MKRLFAFGCSFTRYGWTTWPEIVAEDLGIELYHNLAAPGAGNEFIFNRLMQVDRLVDLNPDDLVMVCWTSVNREDRFVKRRWLSAGNIYSQNTYPPWFVESYYADPEDALLHDFAYIRAARIMLQHRNVAFHQMQMSDMVETLDDWSSINIDRRNDLNELINGELSHIKPSFFKTLWDNDISKRNRVDMHPSPMEHLEYLRRVFEHDWKPSTVRKVERLEMEHREGFKGVTTLVESNDLRFDHLRSPSEIDGIF